MKHPQEENARTLQHFSTLNVLEASFNFSMNVDDTKEDDEVAETKEKKVMAAGIPSWHFQSTKEPETTSWAGLWWGMPPEPVLDLDMYLEHHQRMGEADVKTGGGMKKSWQAAIGKRKHAEKLKPYERCPKIQSTHIFESRSRS